MSATLTEIESETMWAAAAALPPPQRAMFQERVAAELKSLPCGMMGPATLHRIIAACQQTLLRAGAVAVGPSPKHGGTVKRRRGQGEGQARPRGLRKFRRFVVNPTFAAALGLIKGDERHA